MRLAFSARDHGFEKRSMGCLFRRVQMCSRASHDKYRKDSFAHAIMNTFFLCSLCNATVIVAKTARPSRTLRSRTSHFTSCCKVTLFFFHVKQTFNSLLSCWFSVLHGLLYLPPSPHLVPKTRRGSDLASRFPRKAPNP